MAGPFGVFTKAGRMVRSFSKRDEARAYAKGHGLVGPDYARRKALHPEAPTAVMRGHARPSEPSIAALQRGEPPAKGGPPIPLLERSRPETLDRYYRAVAGVREGKTLTQASREVGISPSTVRELDKERSLLFREYPEGKPRFAARTGKEAWHAPWFDGQTMGFVELEVDERNHRIMAKYWADVGWARADYAEGRPGKAEARMAKYRETVVRDIHGNKYGLVTDIDLLTAWYESLTDAEQRRFRSSFESP